jgi:hypothetical protein
MLIVSLSLEIIINILYVYKKRVVVQNKLNLLLTIPFYNTRTLQLYTNLIILIKWKNYVQKIIKGQT